LTTLLAVPDPDQNAGAVALLGGLFGLGVVLVVGIGVILLIREIVCWYWKINRGLALLQEIRDLLAGQAGREARPLPPPPHPAVLHPSA
jgi:hypothetical protein